MRNELLTASLINREIIRLGWTYKADIKGVMEYDIKLDTEIVKLNRGIKYLTFKVSREQLSMNIEDFSENVLQPNIYKILDWDRAFKMETWCYAHSPS